MNKITSFTIDHIRLIPGIYVSRKDSVNGHIITTFDIRMTSPNDEPVMNTAEIHTIEHLGATFLRNHEVYKDQVIYFGPMGCRTGFYLLLADDLTSSEILPLMKEMFSFIASFKGEVPGASAKDCGNYLDMNLPMANFLARKFLEEVLTDMREMCIRDRKWIMGSSGNKTDFRKDQRNEKHASFRSFRYNKIFSQRSTA